MKILELTVILNICLIIGCSGQELFKAEKSLLPILDTLMVYHLGYEQALDRCQVKWESYLKTKEAFETDQSTIFDFLHVLKTKDKQLKFYSVFRPSPVLRFNYYNVYYQYWDGKELKIGKLESEKKILAVHSVLLKNQKAYLVISSHYNTVKSQSETVTIYFLTKSGLKKCETCLPNGELTRTFFSNFYPRLPVTNSIFKPSPFALEKTRSMFDLKTQKLFVPNSARSRVEKLDSSWNFQVYRISKGQFVLDKWWRKKN